MPKTIKQLTVEEAKARMDGSWKIAVPTIHEVYRGWSNRGELVRMPRGDYRLYQKKEKK